MPVGAEPPSASRCSAAWTGAAAPPHVLSADDARLYRTIFSDESEGRFAPARTLIARLSDRSLIGYVEAAHYLSPYSRRPAVLDLAEWSMPELVEWTTRMQSEMACSK